MSGRPNRPRVGDVELFDAVVKLRDEAVRTNDPLAKDLGAGLNFLIFGGSRRRAGGVR